MNFDSTGHTSISVRSGLRQNRSINQAHCMRNWVHYELISEGQRINKEYYFNILMSETIVKNCWNSKRISQDNAPLQKLEFKTKKRYKYQR